MVRHRLPLLLLAVSLSACVSTKAIQLGTPGRYPPVDPDQVQVFLKEEDVTVKFDKVATIEATGNYQFANNEKMVKALKKKAAKLGANGIILGEFKDPSTAGKVTNALIGVGGERKTDVIAIRLLQ